MEDIQQALVLDEKRNHKSNKNLSTLSTYLLKVLLWLWLKETMNDASNDLKVQLINENFS